MCINSLTEIILSAVKKLTLIFFVVQGSHSQIIMVGRL